MLKIGELVWNILLIYAETIAETIIKEVITVLLKNAYFERCTLLGKRIETYTNKCYTELEVREIIIMIIV